MELIAWVSAVEAVAVAVAVVLVLVDVVLVAVVVVDGSSSSRHLASACSAVACNVSTTASWQSRAEPIGSQVIAGHERINWVLVDCLRS